MRNKIYRTGLFVTLIFVLSSCSVVMAVKQPGKKDLSILREGVSRDVVVANLGAPISVEETDEGRVEIYQFTQGYHMVNKVGRGLFHGAADFFTLGLWEVVGTPTEAIFDGREMAVKIVYDSNNEIKNAVYLRGKK